MGDEAAAEPRICVVLVRTRNPLNIGAVARAMANFGLSELRLVQPFEDSWREARSAVGASEILERAQVHGQLPEAIADCSLAVGTSALEQRRPEQPVWSLPEWRDRLSGFGPAGKIGLVFGSEKHGLTRQDLSYCHAVLRVPTAAMQPSMNLGQAVAVCLYEIGRSPAVSSGDATDEPASGAALERIAASLNRLLAASGYTKPGTHEATETHVREMLRRMRIRQADADLLTGMLAKLLYSRREP